MPVANPPHGLQLVIDFVNTLDLDRDEEALDSPMALERWLNGRGLEAGRLGGRRAELHRALELREALRAVIHAHNGGPDPGPAVETMRRAAERGGLAVSFADDGAGVLTVRGDGFDGALARLLAPVAAASADGVWGRVKACHDGTCRWAFYDASRNRSGRWCDMAVCGNRTKVRAYRQRSAG